MSTAIFVGRAGPRPTKRKGEGKEVGSRESRSHRQLCERAGGVEEVDVAGTYAAAWGHGGGGGGGWPAGSRT